MFKTSDKCRLGRGQHESRLAACPSGILTKHSGGLAGRLCSLTLKGICCELGGHVGGALCSLAVLCGAGARTSLVLPAPRRPLGHSFLLTSVARNSVWS